MRYKDLMEMKDITISFHEISEPRMEGAMLRITVLISKDATDLMIFPHPDSKALRADIEFKNYVTYSVVHDDYTVWDNEEVFEGEVFRVYMKSKLQDFVKKEYAYQGIRRKRADALFFCMF
ncbi:hypothetical protein [Bacillus sp. AG4(2022)]|uniref:hypothetical protein n=1 Tax=Bacillus sp. AG4(2022) TaxID=2962594 RepID=UPI0028821DF2|nr:hypothetical protein [Bacillus sp. AG4(2022)]MDT0162470.1 hypothetical protein [Bacillus sp. AG4(2022)]